MSFAAIFKFKTLLWLVFLWILRPALQDGCPENILNPIDLPENTTTGYVLYNTTNATLELTNNGGGYLGLNDSTSTSVVFLNKTLDYETQQQITGSFKCTSGSVAGAISFELRIVVTDVNEHSPVFRGAPYYVTIEEDVKLGKSIFGFVDCVDGMQNSLTGNSLTGTPVCAEDPDKSAYGMQYSLMDGFGVFIMESKSVIVNGTLDYEQRRDPYILNISAQELLMKGSEGFTNYTTLTVNVTNSDDLGPVFNSSTYTLQLKEGSYTGQLFNTEPPLSAFDGDGLGASISFTIDLSSRDLLQNNFTVQSNGAIAVNGYIVYGQYTLNIRAFQTDRPTDRFNVSSVQVSVAEVNDHKPVMSQPSYNGSVLENSPLGTTVLTVSASDDDIGNNRVFLFHLNTTSSLFNITSVGDFGFITVAGSLDREIIMTNPCSLQVFAMESLTNESLRSNISIVTIYILDDNDNSPNFTQTSYTFTVNQTATPRQVIGRVNATDADQGDNGRVSYSIQPQDGVSNYFTVDNSTGNIMVASDLTASPRIISFFVVAQDNPMVNSQRRSSMVPVTVTKVNLIHPAFKNKTFQFTVDETAALGQQVGKIEATGSVGVTLNYSLSGDTAFELQPGSPPTLVVRESLDLDNDQSHADRNLTVFVSDGFFNDSASIRVHVAYENEFSPLMTRNMYTANVLESATPGVFVVQVSATDKDFGTDGSLTYSITHNIDNGPFLVDPKSGYVNVSCSSTRCLDYNNRTQYVFIVEARDVGNKSAAATVVISVVNINDKSPQFMSTTYWGSVAENLASGITVLQLRARDEDTPEASLAYSITTVNPAGTLKLNGSYVITNRSLDAEETPFISAMVKVSDGTNEDNVALNVTVEDKNDNVPQLTLGENPINLLENSTLQTHVLTVKVTDKDQSTQQFTFWLERSAGKFAINRSSGDISVVGAFDRRLQKSYEVDVWVSDNGLPPLFNSSVLYVNITNSNTNPIFVNSSQATVFYYNFYVPENAAVGSDVGHVYTSDPDSGSSGQVSYNYSVRNPDSDVFRLDATTGILTLERGLNYEEKRNYTLVVQATDNSFEPGTATTTVTINVLDIVETPEWPSIFPVVHLVQNDRCDSIQLAARSQDVVTATTSSVGVIYSLLNYTDQFSIDNTTGLLRAKGTLREQTFFVGLRACSQQNVSVCADTILTVRVESNSPLTFCPPFYIVSVNESARVNHMVIDLNSTQGDNVLYSFVQPVDPATAAAFYLNNSTGVVYVNQALDRENTSYYTFLVAAHTTSSGSSATAQVTVIVLDAPDSKPTFTLPLYEGEIFENATIHQPVLNKGSKQPLRVTAEDKDLNYTLTYSISKDDSNSAFTVNPATGEITLAKAIDLEAMSEESFSLQVRVDDGYFNDTTKVIIHVLDINDNSPEFYPSVLNLNVSESASVYSVLTVLNVTDKDVSDRNRIVFKILLDNGEVPFKVDNVSRELILLKPLDREKTGSYNFTVVADDLRGRNGSAQVNIVVEDSNTQSPVFENSTYIFSVKEGNDSVGANFSLIATDADTGLNSLLTYHISRASVTGLNISTENSKGILRITGVLDRELSPTIVLEVTATDGGAPQRTGTCTVSLVLQDVNDNPPHFTSAYRADVSEGAPNNTELKLFPPLSVTDADEGDFGSSGVVYSLNSNRTMSQPFRVDPKNGTLYVKFSTANESLDREISSFYSLILVATDNHGSGLSGTTSVTVMVNNVNDHPPSFTQRNYEWIVTENLASGYVIGTVNATDGDNDPKGHLYYRIINGSDGRFNLDPFTGNLTVAGQLDRETRDQYNLTLDVTDGYYRDTVTANIRVTDVNDNCPEFTAGQPFLLQVPEKQPSHSIYNFTVTDRDLGDNGKVTVFINDSSVESYLSVSPSGELKTKQEFDRDLLEQGTLSFIIWAHDSGSPPCYSSRQEVVEIIGVNEHDPQICYLGNCDNRFNFILFSDSPTGTFVAIFTGKDQDMGEDGRVTISLSDDKAQLLSFDSVSGVLTLNRNLTAVDLANNVTYTATLTASDHGSPPRNVSAFLSFSVVQRDHETPVFRETVYRFTVPENKDNYVVGSILAVATRGDLQITYKLQDAQPFEVDIMGNITTSSALDREKQEHYTFLVMASSGMPMTNTATAVVLISVLDTNDNPPEFVFPVSNVTIQENKNNTNLLTLLAIDRDAGINAKVTYTLVNTSLSHVFLVNSSTGALSLFQPLDREKKSFYTLFIQAEDAGSPALNDTAIVQVTVEDVNDNPPIFKQSSYTGYVDLTADAFSNVLTVTATDSDYGLNGHVIYQLDPLSGYFYINEQTGEVKTLRVFPYATQDEFQLTVKALDLGSPQQSNTVNVSAFVRNLTNILPKLTLDPQRVALVLGTLKDTPVPVNVSGGLRDVTFNITEGNESGLFLINPLTGQIRVTSDLEQPGEYRLTIKVTNSLLPQYSTQGQLIIIVTDVQMDQESYAAILPENSREHLPILLLDINSNAEKSGVPVAYTLTSSISTDLFFINPSTGLLYCNGTLDREITPQYTLRVSAQLVNSRPASSVARRKRELNNVAEVVIIVKDVNDNPPIFDPTSSLFGIASSAPALTKVTTLKAVDLDEGENGDLLYETTGGDTGVFFITPEGEVKSQTEMKWETRTSFQLNIKATDQRGQGQAGTTTIKIVVVPSSNQFGLTANMPITNFTSNQDFYTRNLSSILGMTLQLDKVESHGCNSIDNKIDIYFFAFDSTGALVPFDTVQRRVNDNAKAVNLLLNTNSVQVLTATEACAVVRVESSYGLTAVDIALIVVAILIFVVALIAIVVACRMWRKQKKLQEQEQAASRARMNLDSKDGQRPDRTPKTTFVVDPEEPLELDMDPDDGRTFNPRMFLKSMRESEGRQPKRIDTEDQEVMVNIDNENKGIDTVALRRAVRDVSDSAQLEEILQEIEQDDSNDSGTDQRSPIHDAGSRKYLEPPARCGKAAGALREHDGPAADKKFNSNGRNGEVRDRLIKTDKADPGFLNPAFTPNYENLEMCRL